MRISTSQIYSAGTLGIQRNQSGLYTLQNQLSTGRRVLTPADDPVAAAQALVVGQSKSIVTQQMDNQAAARSQLAQVEGTLSSMTNLMQEVRERVVQAGNTTLTLSDRAFIATELEARLQELIGIANTSDGAGQYMFSGYQGNVRPFAITGQSQPSYPARTPPVTYHGDDGERLLQVGPSRQMSVSLSGNDVFMDIKNGNGTFVTGIGGTLTVADRNNTGGAYINAGLVDDASAWSTATQAHASLQVRFNDDGLGNLSYELLDADGVSLTAPVPYDPDPDADPLTPPPSVTIRMENTVAVPPQDFGAEIVVNFSSAPAGGDTLTITPATFQNEKLASAAIVAPVTWNETTATHPHFDIRFVDVAGTMSYEILDAQGVSLTDPPMPYRAGQPISLERTTVGPPATVEKFGAEVVIDGLPMAGDSVRVAPSSFRNGGDAVIDMGSVTDPGAWQRGVDTYGGFGIRFNTTVENNVATSTYEIYRADTGASLTPTPKTFTPGQAIVIEDTTSNPPVSFGAQVVVTGQPADGDSFTVAPSTSQSVFQTIQNLIGVLRQPVGATSFSTTEYTNRLGTELNNIDRVLDNINAGRADVGARLKELDSLTSASGDLELQHSTTLSELQDLDYAAAISAFTQQQIQLEAAQKSFAQISRLSLFDIL